jgi:S1-C subfamily serine protease
MAFKAFGSPKKEKKESLSDFSRDQQTDPAKIHDASFLNAVVKVYCTHTAPDYSLPWQKQRQFTSTGSAFMIGDGKLLTNAHCVEHDTQVKVKRRGDDRKYVAKVLVRGVDCDIALLSVESEDFWKGAEPLRLGHLPRLQVPSSHQIMMYFLVFSVFFSSSVLFKYLKNTFDGLSEA